jgi:hypothetical protein
MTGVRTALDMDRGLALLRADRTGTDGASDQEPSETLTSAG